VGSPGHLAQRSGRYAAHEPRLMKRCQVLADKVFDPVFTSGVLSAA
jgi:hypothetical protein